MIDVDDDVEVVALIFVLVYILVGLSVLGIGLGLLVAPAAVADPVDSGESEPQAVVDAAPAETLDGVPHLPSPDNLPPGTTQAAPEQQSLGYLRDLVHAVRSEDVTMKDALLLLAQRPMDVPETSMSSHRPGEPPAPETVEPAQAPQPTPAPNP